MSDARAIPLPDQNHIWLFGAVIAYFAIQLGLRLVYASSLGLDEAEMLVVTQQLAPGYGSQPPLYAWLQLSIFAVFGKTLFALAFLRFLLMLLTFIFAYLIGREVFADDRKAWASAMGLFTVPMFFWGSQLALTHTVLAAAIGTITLYFTLRLAKTGATRDYLALGLCIALGVLSKYNYAILVVALLLSALMVPDFRRRVFDLRLLATLALALLLLSPHIVWLIDNLQVALAESGKLKIGGNATRPFVDGLEVIYRALISYAALPVVLIIGIAYTPLARRFRQTGATTTANAGGWPEGRRFVVNVFVVGVALVAGAVLIAQMASVNERWMHPILFITPLGLLIALERRFNPARITLLNIVCSTIAIGAMAGLLVKYAFPDLGKKPQWALAPFVALADDIRAMGFDGGYILAPSAFIAGNLKYRFPESTVGEPRYGLWPPAKGAAVDEVLLVAQGGGDNQRTTALWQQLCGRQASETIEIDWRPFSENFESSNVAYEVSMAIVPMCQSPRYEAERTP